MAQKAEFKMVRGFGKDKKPLDFGNHFGGVPTRRKAIAHLERLVGRRQRGGRKWPGPAVAEACEHASRLISQLKAKTKKKLPAGLASKVAETLKSFKLLK